KVERLTRSGGDRNGYKRRAKRVNHLRTSAVDKRFRIDGDGAGSASSCYERGNRRRIVDGDVFCLGFLCLARIRQAYGNLLGKRVKLELAVQRAKAGEIGLLYRE